MSDTQRLEQRVAWLERQLELTKRITGDAGVSTYVFDGPSAADCRVVPEGVLWEVHADRSAWPTLEQAMARPSAPVAHLRMLRERLQGWLDSRAPYFETEYSVSLADGSVAWMLGRGTIDYDANGEPASMNAIASDITALKRGEEKTERATAMLALATKLSQVYIWQFDFVGGAFDNGRATFINVWESLGYDPNDAPTDFAASMALVVHAEDHPSVMLALAACIRGETPNFRVEYRVHHADGSLRWNLAHGIVTRDASGVPLSLIGTSYDVTALKRAEEEARHHKERLELSILGSKACTWDFELPDGKLLNARATYTNVFETLGYTPEDDTSRFPDALAALIPPERQGAFVAEIQSHLDGTSREWENVYAVRFKDGSERWHLSRGVIQRDPASGHARRLTGISIDVTERTLMEHALRDSEQRVRAVFENSAFGFFVTSLQGTFLDCNTALCTLLGYSRDELVGQDARPVFSPEELPEARERQRALLAGEVARQSFDTRYRRRNGTVCWINCTFSVMSRDESGAATHILGIVQDITSRKNLEEDLKRTTERLELGTSGSGTTIFDLAMPTAEIADDHPLHRGATMTLIGWENFGYDPATSITDAAQVGQLLHHPDDHQRANEVTQAYLSGASPKLETEYRIRHADGSFSWRLVRGQALRDAAGYPTRLIGSMVDITELKRIEEELHAARQAAELANRAKDEFLANVSHEIRTPMNAILGMTELALDASETAHQRQLLSTVRVAARNLLQVINDLLDFSKITAGKLALDHADFSLRAAIGDTLRALAVRAHRKGLELVYNVDPEVPDLYFGDAGRVRQVLMNLISNAIKFTPRGEVVVQVMLDRDALPDDAIPLRFTVHDTGIGIAPEKHASIFRAFEQEDASTTRKFGGTGLGLTIASQLATLMGGQITVDSEPGRGSTFSFTARISRSSKAEWPGVSHSGLLDGLEVLVVDDNETNREILIEWLGRWRMRPIAAADAAAAFEVLERAQESASPCPLVLLDGHMPDIDGITLAGKIRARFGPSAHRLILLSSDHSSALATRAREAGIHGYLLKPVQQSELLETIWTVMSASANIESLSRIEAGAEPAPGSRLLNVLVAEDNELNVALLRELLSQRNHRVDVADDGRAALELASKDDPAYDVMLLDLHMPELDGFEVVRAIRERERGSTKHLPIVALTARSSPRDRETSLAAGMDEFLSKPIDVEALWSALDRVTSREPSKRHRSPLLDARVILQTCGGRPAVLERLLEIFRRSVPEHLAAIRAALVQREFSQLRVSAHMLAATLSAFSRIAGALASTLEDAAFDENLERCTALVGQLESTSATLLDEVRDLTLESLSA